MKRKLLVSVVAMLSVVGLAAACTPPAPDGGLPSVNWSFKGTQVKVISSQDCTLGFINCKDEPFLLNVAFRVKIGKKDSAQAWVVNNRTAAPQDVAPGSTIILDDANQAGHGASAAGGPVTFAGVKPVDLLDLANTNNKLEVVGTYTWAAEEDEAGLGTAAQTVANLLKDSLNATLAKDNLAGLDAQAILNKILASLFNNIGGAFVLGLQNIEDWFGSWGLGDISDDALGGAVYVGIGAHGSLGSTINGLLGGVSIPDINLPVSIPPSIKGGGIYTMTGTKNFTQTFTGQGGSHQWWMTAGKAS